MPLSAWLKDSPPSNTADIDVKNTTRSKKNNGPKSERVKEASIADKHQLYQESVQSPSAEITTLLSMYTQHSPSGRHPIIFREDFCGTAILCQEWLRRDPRHVAIGVDIDASVLAYAKTKWVNDMDKDRIRIVQGNVMDVQVTTKADILCALNYGVFYFKQRALLVRYFKKCLDAIRDDGMMVCDVFGGAQCYQGGKRSFRDYGAFQYRFEQKYFDIMTNTAKCAIHFNFPDGSVMKNAFNYDFRVYTILEVRECMMEAGFKTTHVWYATTEEKYDEKKETDSDDGAYFYEKVNDGDKLFGVWAWNAYVIGLK